MAISFTDWDKVDRRNELLAACASNAIEAWNWCSLHKTELPADLQSIVTRGERLIAAMDKLERKDG